MAQFSDKDLRGLRVLVVEDAFSMALIIETTLKALGCTVIGPASRLDKALPLLDRELDCAILDINLDGEDAYPLITALQRRGVPLILTTGYEADALRPDFRGLPRLEKPFAMEAMVAAMVRAFLPRRDQA